MANRVWSSLTEKERDEDGIYQRGYADGRKCMALHLRRLQKKIDKLEGELKEHPYLELEEEEE